MMRSAMSRPAAVWPIVGLGLPVGGAGLAVLAAAAWSVIDPSRALWVAVSVLIVTCPCASRWLPGGAGTPPDLRRGVVVKRLEAIEALAGVSHVFIDKTGTLTEDRLGLRDAGHAGLASSGRLPARAASLAHGRSIRCRVP
jgi:Cu2+-exporting ATPase